MPFWRKESKITLVLRSVPTMRKKAIFLVLLLGASGFWATFWLLPERAIYKNKKQQGAALSTQAKALTAIVAKRQQLEVKHARLAQQVSQFSIAVGSLQETVSKLIHVMRVCGLSCRELKPLGTKQHEYYEKHVVSLGCKGSFHEVLRFLEEVEKPAYPVTIKSIVLRKARGGQLLLDAIIRVISFKDI